MPQLLDQSKQKLSTLSANELVLDQIEDANNMNNIQVSPDVLSTLMSLQQDNLYKLQQHNLHGISRSSRLEMFCKKASLKTYAKCTGDTRV